MPSASPVQWRQRLCPGAGTVNSDSRYDGVQEYSRWSHEGYGWADCVVLQLNLGIGIAVEPMQWSAAQVFEGRGAASALSRVGQTMHALIRLMQRSASQHLCIHMTDETSIDGSI
jgi:hypothetical protein